SGMRRDEVASVLPAVLARTGGVASGSSRAPSPRAWLDAIQGAVAGGSGLAARRDDAARALALAEAQGWNDARTAFSHFALARLEVTRDPALAARHFDMAEAIWARLPGTDIHRAHIDLQRASMALAAGDAATAIARADRALPALSRSGNAALEATALLIKAEALSLMGRDIEADRLRLDSRALQRYGFGRGSDVEARVHEIAALPRRVGSN
ncbi:MAG: ATP-dependent transcriptional regulator, partial [Pseudomonadota bacterium]